MLEVGIEKAPVGGEVGVPDLRRCAASQGVLELRFFGRRPFEPGGIDQFDAVVRMRVVAGGDRDAGIGAGVSDQVCHRRGR